MRYSGVDIEVSTLSHWKPGPGNPHGEPAMQQTVVIDKPIEDLVSVELVALTRQMPRIQLFWHLYEGRDKRFGIEVVLDPGQPQEHEAILSKMLGKGGITKSQLHGAGVISRTMEVWHKLVQGCSGRSVGGSHFRIDAADRHEERLLLWLSELGFLALPEQQALLGIEA
jgi:hypothetical protein